VWAALRSDLLFSRARDKPRAHGGQGNTHARNALARLVKRLGEKTKLAFPMHIRYTELTLTRCKEFFGELGGQHG
jgi:hypothetical protein